MTIVPVNTPVIDAADRAAVLECLEGGWISSEGPQVAAFERQFAAAFGREHGVAVSSGTGALDVAVRALGIGPGDEVLVPSLTIISCAQAIVSSGARPVPVDCDPLDWNAHLEHFEARATARTRAVMLVHLYGLCGDVTRIVAWARARSYAIIEDASQAVGLQHEGRPCGSFGDAAVFSLYANKRVTTGEGGMILCSSAPLAEQCRRLRNLCFDAARRFWHEDLGWNYRMTAMQAALGRAQLTRLDEIVRRGRELGLAYYAALSHLAMLRAAPPRTMHAENVYWMFGMVVQDDAPFSREDLLGSLGALGIATRTFFYGLHQQPALLERGLVDAVSLPVTESLAARGFYLPGGVGLSREDHQRVVEAVCACAGDRPHSTRPVEW